MKTKTVAIPASNPAEAQYHVLIGIRAGLDHARRFHDPESARDRAAHALMQAQTERQEAFIDRRVAESSRRMAIRVYIASVIVFMSALAVFVAALVVGAM